MLMIIRATIAVESFCRTYSVQFYKSHQTYIRSFLVIMVSCKTFKGTQAETMKTVWSIETNSHKNMSLIERQKVSTTIMAYEGYYKT
jgi:hypothetical protein